MFPLCGGEVNLLGYGLSHTACGRLGGRESPALSNARLAEKAGLWDAAGPHVENTATCRATSDTRPLWMSRPEAPP